MHNHHGSQENNIEIHRIRCFAYGADLLWADLHLREQSCPPSRPRHLLVSLQLRQGLVSQQAARRRRRITRQRSQRQSAQRFPHQKGNKSLVPTCCLPLIAAPAPYTQRGPGGGAAMVAFDWTKKTTLTSKQVGSGLTGLKGLYLDVRSLRTPGDTLRPNVPNSLLICVGCG